MTVARFFEASARLDSREALIEAFHDAVGDLGYDRVHYFSFPTPETRGPSSEVVLYSGLPPEWFSHYDAEKYEEIDPLGAWAVHSHSPFVWDQVLEGLKLSRRQQRLIRDIREAELGDGITVPIHGPFGQVSGVCLSRRPQGAPDARTVHIGRVLAVQFHHAFGALGEDDSTVAPLTPREKDVLLGLSSGVSNPVLADQLGISEHSVKFHLQNASRKLNVNSRVAAVVKAIRLGLIVP
jgi:DNA-binding CsgD family transcriptional regulator